MKTRRIIHVYTSVSLLLSLFLVSISCTPPRKEASQDQKKYTRIASMAPACTTILSGIGLAENIVAIDTWSVSVPGMKADIPRFDMMKPNIELLAALECDLVFVSDMTREGTSKDPFKPLSEAGVKVVYIPTSKTLADIRNDVALIAGLTGKTAEGEALVSRMDREIERISEIVRSIPQNSRRTVVFEIASAPNVYSFGKGVYLNELLEAAGAINALGAENGWIAVSAETIVASDPDVILTNVDYLEDPVAEIKGRPGWAGMKAVTNGRVYRIDSATSSQPTPDVTKALLAIAEAVYPEYFK